MLASTNREDILDQVIFHIIGGIVSKETVCCVGGKVKH